MKQPLQNPTFYVAAPYKSHVKVNIHLREGFFCYLTRNHKSANKNLYSHELLYIVADFVSFGFFHEFLLMPSFPKRL